MDEESGFNSDRSPGWAGEIGNQECRVLLDLLQEGIWSINTDLKTTYVNQRMAEMLGFTPAEMVGRSLYEFTDTDWAERCREFVERRRKGVREEHEFVFRRQDGRPCRVQVTAAPLLNDSGDFTGALAAVQNITEYKKREEEIQQNEEKFALAFYSSPYAIIVTRVGDSVILDVNRGFERIAGFSRAEAIGKTALELGLWANVEDRRLVVSDLLANRRFSQKEFLFRKKSGELINGLFSAESIAFNGEPCFLSNIDDITGLRRAETERLKLHEQLQHSTKMEAVGRLAGGIAHDFNNLLTAILGYVSLSLLELPEHHPLREYILEVRKAADSAATLIRQLLAFSRKQVIEPRVVNVNQVVIRLHNMLQRLLGENIELRTLLDEDLGQVRFDPGQFEQVIVNLAVNARDAMPTGGTLILETANVSLDEDYCRNHNNLEPGEYVRFSVSDDGHGMPSEIKSRIFEPFFTTKERERGTGLGLAMVYGAVMQNRGNIDVYSEPGQGTTFKVQLPRVNEAPEPIPLNGDNGLVRGTEKVILVEDDISVRKLALLLLKSLGYQVEAYANGDDALSAVERMAETIHLLVTDVVLPGMNGRALAERMQALRPDLKVLFTSGYTHNVIVQHGVLEKGIEFIAKPYSLKLLAKRVREVLDK